MVRRTGLEPARVSPLAPQASASANSAISARQTRSQRFPAWCGTHPTRPARREERRNTIQSNAIPPGSATQQVGFGCERFRNRVSRTAPLGGRGTHCKEARKSFQFVCAKPALCSTMWGSRDRLDGEQTVAGDARPTRIHGRLGLRPAVFRSDRWTVVKI